MTNEKTIRTREDQVIALVELLYTERLNLARAYAEDHIREAEARGAAQARAEDAKGQEPVAYTSSRDLDRVQKGKLGDIYGQSEYEGDCEAFPIPIYSRPANVAVLEARIEGLDDAILNELSIYREYFAAQECAINPRSNDVEAARRWERAVGSLQKFQLQKKLRVEK